MSLKFPADALVIQEPFAAALAALPVWWNEWMRLYAAYAETMSWLSKFKIEKALFAKEI